MSIISTKQLASCSASSPGKRTKLLVWKHSAVVFHAHQMCSELGKGVTEIRFRGHILVT